MAAHSRNPLAQTLALLALGGLVALGCAADKKGGITGGSKTKKDEAEKPPAGTDQTEVIEDGGTDDDGGGPASLSLEEIIKQCGIEQSDLDNPDKVLVDKQLKSWPKVFIGAQAAPIVGNVNFKVTITTKVQVKATMTEITQSTDFDVKGEPSQAQAPAMEKVAPLRGNSVSKSLTSDERMKLFGENDQWTNIVCTVLPVKELSTTRGGKGKVVKFDPPLPANLSPKADPARYEAEIGAGRSWDNIKAEIIGSTDPAFAEGQTYTGKVKITKVDPTLTLQIGTTGQTQVIKTDLAYKIEWDFGSVDVTVGLGLMPSQTIFISHEKRDFKVIVADTGFAEGGKAVLSDEL